jgi:hypothetical protein
MFIRLVAPFLLRWLVAFFFKKAVKNSGFGQHQTYNHQAAPKQPAGKIKIDYIPEEKQKQRKEFNGGEYVDYEEVK